MNTHNTTRNSYTQESSLTVEVRSCQRIGWLRAFERLEAFAGVLATLLLGFAPVMGGATATIALLNDGHPVLATCCGGLTLVIAGLATLVGALYTQAARACFPEWSDDPSTQLHLKSDDHERFHPANSFAVEVGLSIPPIARGLQPIASLWWLGHFLGGALALLAAHQLVGGKVPVAPLEVLAAAGIHFAFLLGANIYLLLAVAVWFPDERTLWHVWSYRFLIDFGLISCIAFCSI